MDIMETCEENGSFITKNKRSETETCIDGALLHGNSPESRQKWGNHIEGVLAALGYMIGTGNLWRFPYLCLQNGGGAFLIPFVLSGVVLVFPLLFLEASLGQFTSKAIHQCWEACPLLKGIGYGMLMMQAIYCCFIIILVWISFYLVTSFISPLPWTTCYNWWNTEHCYVPHITNISSESNVTTFNNASYTTNTEEYFERRVLQLSNGIENLGDVNGYLLLALFVSWFIVFLCLMKGTRSVGKVVYFTVILPYVLMIILLVRSVMEEGAVDGIKFFITPEFGKLSDVNVWMQAALQILHSSGVCWGVMITLPGYNKFKNNLLRDAVVYISAEVLTSVLCGILVFSTLGAVAHAKGLHIVDVAKSGPGLAFVVYPEVVSKLPISNFWAVIFFLTIFLLALDSTFGTYEPIIAAVCDSFKITHRHRIITTACIILSFLVLTIPLTFQGGFYIFQLIDWYLVSWCFPVFGIIECLIFGWIYGIERFSKDVEMMTDKAIPVFFRLCWRYITPVILLILFVAVISLYEPPSYGDYDYPKVATTFGVMLAVLPLLPIPVVAIVQIKKAQGKSLIQKIQNATRPSTDWGSGRAYNVPVADETE